MNSSHTDEPGCAELAPHVDKALNDLPDEQRLVIIEHFLQRRTQKEIAQELGVSAMMISRRIATATEELRKKLKKAGVVASAVTLAAFLSEQSASAVPASLTASLGKMAAAGTEWSTTAAEASSWVAKGVVPGALTAATKMKIVAAALAGVIVIGGTVGLAIRGGSRNAAREPRSPQPLQLPDETQANGDQAPPDVHAPRIFGRVTNTDGKPLADVHVSVRSGVMGDNLYRLVNLMTRTDENGRFNSPVDFADIKYLVSFQYRGEGWLYRKVIPAKGEELNVRITRRGEHVIAGSVLNQEAGQAIAGAKVRYFGEYHKFTIEVATDAQGRFKLTGLRNREFQGVIYAEQDGRVSGAQMVRYWSNEKPTEITLALDEGARLEGEVKDAVSGEALEGCSVTITPSYASGFSLEASTGPDGEYVFPHAPPGKYIVTASREDYYFDHKRIDRDIDLQHGQRTLYSLDLKKRATLKGRVVDHLGEPVARAIVAVDEAHTSDNKHSPEVVRTDAAGRFSIRTGHLNTRGGEDALEAFCSKHGYGRGNFEALKEGEVRETFVIHLAGTMRVRGRVTSPAGNPLRDVRVHDTTGFEARTITDGAGRFDLGVLPIRWPDHAKGRVYFLAPRPIGLRVINQMAEVIEDYEVFQAETGFFHHKEISYEVEPDKELDLVVGLEPTELITLTGTVREDKGNALPSARVTLFAGNAGKDTWLETLHPTLTGGTVRGIQDRVIQTTNADEDGKWKMVITRETAKGMQLAYWCRAANNPSLFSIGAEGREGEAALVHNITLDRAIKHKQVDIRFERLDAQKKEIPGRNVDTQGKPTGP